MIRDEHSILIQASADQIWPWLMQMGTGRAGWYSHDWVDNFGRPSLHYLDPEIRPLKLGDAINGLRVTALIENQQLRFSFKDFASYSLELLQCPDETRLTAKLEAKGPKWLVKKCLSPLHNFMQQKQLIELKERAERPFSAACERNKKPLLDQLHSLFGQEHQTVLEIGSGSGQHAIYFSSKLHDVDWTPSEIGSNFGLLQRIIAKVAQKSRAKRLKPALHLELGHTDPPADQFDAVFCSNVLHIVPQDLAEVLFDWSKSLVRVEGSLLFYGPFKINGKFTSQSNERFDEELRLRHHFSGIRDLEWVVRSLNLRGLHLKQVHDLPAHNQLLVFKKSKRT